MTDDQLKSAIGLGLCAWLFLGFVDGLAVVSGLGAVLALIATVVLLMRRRNRGTPAPQAKDDSPTS